MKSKVLYEIMVPCNYNTGKPVRTRHHKEWDKYVRGISGGLTLFKPAKGQWLNQKDSVLYADRVIPVRIACTPNQIKKIALFTKGHYRQIRVMVYTISEHVEFY